MLLKSGFGFRAAYAFPASIRRLILKRAAAMRLRKMSAIAVVTFCALFGPAPASALQVDGTTALSGTGSKLILSVSHMPDRENLGVLSATIRIHSDYPISDIGVFAPQNSVWSQIRPLFVRNGQTVTVSAIAPSIIQSVDSSLSTVFRIEFTIPSLTSTSYRDIIDTLWIAQALSTAGENLTVAVSNWGTLSEAGMRPGSIAGAFNVLSRQGRNFVLRYTIKEPMRITCRVIDTRGRLIRVLHDSDAKAGIQQVVWDGTRGNRQGLVAAGIYYMMLEGKGFAYSKEVRVMR